MRLNEPLNLSINLHQSTESEFVGAGFLGCLTVRSLWIKSKCILLPQSEYFYLNYLRKLHVLLSCGCVVYGGVTRLNGDCCRTSAFREFQPRGFCFQTLIVIMCSLLQYIGDMLLSVGMFVQGKVVRDSCKEPDMDFIDCSQILICPR